MQVVNVIDHSDRTRFRHSICCLEPERRELARSDELQKRFGESARYIAVRECSLEVAVRRHKAMYEGAARRKRA